MRSGWRGNKGNAMRGKTWKNPHTRPSVPVSLSVSLAQLCRLHGSLNIERMKESHFLIRETVKGGSLYMQLELLACCSTGLHYTGPVVEEKCSVLATIISSGHAFKWVLLDLVQAHVLLDLVQVFLLCHCRHPPCFLLSAALLLGFPSKI